MQLDLRDKVFIEYNVRQVLDRFIPSRLSIKDVWELCAASGVTRIFGFWWCIRKGGQRLTDCEFLGFGGMWFPWCLRCPIAVCKFFLLIAMEKTACIGMLTVFVSPLKLLSLVAALLSWKIATAPFFANVWKNNFCVLSTLIWLLDIHILAILQVHALGLIMFACSMLCCTQWFPLQFCLLWVRSYNESEDLGNEIAYQSACFFGIIAVFEGLLSKRLQYMGYVFIGKWCSAG